VLVGHVCDSTAVQVDENENTPWREWTNTKSVLQQLALEERILRT